MNSAARVDPLHVTRAYSSVVMQNGAVTVLFVACLPFWIWIERPEHLDQIHACGVSDQYDFDRPDHW